MTKKFRSVIRVAENFVGCAETLGYERQFVSSWWCRFCYI